MGGSRMAARREGAGTRRHGAFGSGRALVRCSRLQHARCSAAATGALRPGESTACTQGGSGRPRLWRGPPASTSAPRPKYPLPFASAE
ncbi:unnamed protein product [Prorocentrum cordatum]|uniref:Uncharacterized protein n=1 Tax=Prorocentrum cordatum TaxID=2364126 RepID=A0ABN9UF02_9DINO|nr:unnamed protein product [Polarella glacialis]